MSPPIGLTIQNKKNIGGTGRRSERGRRERPVSLFPLAVGPQGFAPSHSPAAGFCSHPRLLSRFRPWLAPLAPPSRGWHRLPSVAHPAMLCSVVLMSLNSAYTLVNSPCLEFFLITVLCVPSVSFQDLETNWVRYRIINTKEENKPRYGVLKGLRKARDFRRSVQGRFWWERVLSEVWKKRVSRLCIQREREGENDRSRCLRAVWQVPSHVIWKAAASWLGFLRTALVCTLTCRKTSVTLLGLAFCNLAREQPPCSQIRFYYLIVMAVWNFALRL